MDTDRKILLLPGLGADGRLFRSFVRSGPLGQNIQVIQYTPPLRNETLASYAMRILDEQVKPNPYADYILVGVSLGGMLAAEMSQHLPNSTTFLISSVKSNSEKPVWMRLLRWVPLHKLLSGGQIRWLSLMATKVFGGFQQRNYKVIEEMFMSTPTGFIRWAANEAINWKGIDTPNNIVHLHGLRDVLFPAHLIKNFIPINGGSHYAILTHAHLLRLQVYNKIRQRQRA